MLSLDHIVLAAPDLERAVEDFAQSTGVRPVEGGPHPGGGTRNALVSFGDGAYLEIIAPDPAQEMAGTNGARFERLERAELLHWALRCDDLKQLGLELKGAGYVPGAILDMARRAPDGSDLRWQLMGVRDHHAGGLVPFFIDWQATPHPTLSAPLVGALESLGLRLPSDLPALEPLLAEVLSAYPDECSDDSKAGPGLRVAFDSPNGPQVLEGAAPKGFRF